MDNYYANGKEPLIQQKIEKSDYTVSKLNMSK
jgi:hypothetical protein